MDRKQRGLFILPPNNSYSSGFNGDLQNFYSSLEYFERSNEEYVIVSSSHMLCNINFTDAVEQHQRTNADITVIYKEMEQESDGFSNLITLDVDDDGRVVRMTENRQVSNKVYMRMIIIRKELLMDLVIEKRASKLLRSCSACYHSEFEHFERVRLRIQRLFGYHQLRSKLLQIQPRAPQARGMESALPPTWIDLYENQRRTASHICPERRSFPFAYSQWVHHRGNRGEQHYISGGEGRQRGCCQKQHPDAEMRD